MTDKELKRLGRAELIDIIFELQKQCDAYTEQNRELQEKLEKRELYLSEAGSIAEASLQINGVFEAAQAAADQYLQSIHAANKRVEEKLAEAEKEKTSILQEATQKAKEIVTGAEQKAQKVKEDADEHARVHWTQFQEKANELLRAHEELSAFMVKKAEK